MGGLIWLGVLALSVLVIVFGSVTIWKWMELRQGSPDTTLQRRVAQLEAEVARLRDEVAEAVLAADEQQWQRLEQSREQPLQAGQ